MTKMNDYSFQISCDGYDMFIPLSQDKISFICFAAATIYNFPNLLFSESSIQQSTVPSIPSSGIYFFIDIAIENGDYIYCYTKRSPATIYCGIADYNSNNLIREKIKYISLTMSF